MAIVSARVIALASPAGCTRYPDKAWRGGCRSLLCLLILGGLAPAWGYSQADSPAAVPVSVGIPGVVSGAVVDSSGQVVRGARVTLTQGAATKAMLVDDNGRFRFDAVPAGAFKLTVEEGGFAAKTVSSELHAGESYEAKAIQLEASTSIEVQVRPVSEIAQEQLKAEEKQRVLGFVPNFYVSYEPNPAPLNTKQKYQLAWKAIIDPIDIATVAAFAGISQAANTAPGFGQGAAGYGKRFGAGYGSFVSSAIISGALFPQVFKEDPRYIYKGTGSKMSRTWYALKSVVVCRRDSGKWGACYSNIFGTIAAGAASNVFYAPSDRNGAALTFENNGIALASDAISNIMEEFVVRHFTPKLPKRKMQP